MLQNKLKSRLSRVQPYGTIASQYCIRAAPTVLGSLRTTVLVNSVLSRNNSQKSTWQILTDRTSFRAKQLVDCNRLTTILVSLNALCSLQRYLLTPHP